MRILMLVAAFVSGLAWSESNTLSIASGSYCEWIQTKAEIERNRLLFPSFELNGYKRFRQDSVDVTNAFNTQLTAQLKFAPLGIWEAGMVGEIASLDCRRNQALAQLENLLNYGENLDGTAGLEARLKILRLLHTEVAQKASRYQRLLHEKELTLVEYRDFQDKLTQLRTQLEELETQRTTLGGLAPLPRIAVRDLLVTNLTAEAESERTIASRQSLRAWDFNLMGGVGNYQSGRAETNLIAGFSLTYWFGDLFAPSAGEVARHKLDYLERTQGGLPARLQLRRAELQRRLDSDRGRLKELGFLVSYLQEKLQLLRKVDSARGKWVADGIWMDVERYRAEEAQLKLRSAAIEGFLTKFWAN